MNRKYYSIPLVSFILIMGFVFQACDKYKEDEPAENTAPEAFFTVTPESGKIDTEFKFDASGSIDEDDPTNLLEVRWDFDSDGSWDSDWDTLKTATHQFDSVKVYNVTLEVRDSEDLSEQESKSVTVAVGSAPEAAFVITPDSGTIFTEFTFDASGSIDEEDPTSLLEVRWDFNSDGLWDSEWDTSKTVTHQFDSVKVYNVTLEVRDTENLSDQGSKSLTVATGTAPEAVFNVTPENGIIITEFTLDASESRDNEETTDQLEVRWDFESDGNWDIDWSANKIVTHKYPDYGTYEATLEVRDSEFLTDQYVKSISIISPDTIGPDGFDWVFVEAGTFDMGTNYGPWFNGPIHSVTLHGFLITRFEITNAQYVEFLNDINCNSNGTYNDPVYGVVEYINMYTNEYQMNYINGQFVVYEGKENYPVMKVTWYGANAFAEWAGGSLPTEAQWEFAARGGNKSMGYVYSGSNNIDDVAWYWDNANETTHEVGQKLPNELGLYDMSGNVREWCSDWFGYTYYQGSPQFNPQGPSNGDDRAARGGTYGNAWTCRVGVRNHANPDYSDYGVMGFRIVY